MSETYRVEDPETGLPFYRSAVEETETDYSIAVKLASDALLNAMICRLHASKLQTYERFNISTGANVGPELKDARHRAHEFFGRARATEFADFLEGVAEAQLDPLATKHRRKTKN